MRPLTVHYRGGSLDGVTDQRGDDQVPNQVGYVTSEGWEDYVVTGRVYEDEVLVEITYQFVDSGSRSDARVGGPPRRGHNGPEER